MAEKLGMTKAQLLRSVSSEELTEWMALWKIRNEEYEARK